MKWGSQLTRIAAQRMRTARAESGQTQTELGKRFASVRYPLTQQTIAKIELGERRPTFEDVLVAAWALGISPMTLLAPSDPDELVEITPKMSVDAATFRAWLRGHGTSLLPGSHTAEELAAQKMGVALHDYERRLDRLREHAHKGKRAAVARSLRLLARQAELDADTLKDEGGR